MIKATMVLEGGAARGIFTAGVLDYLMEKEVYTTDVIGVSAGACNASGYVSRQIGRAKQCLIHEDGSFSYMNLRNFAKTKSLVDMDIMFDVFPNHTYPFHYDTYFASETTNYVGVTNCMTGKIEYMTEESDRTGFMKMCRASSSMPLVSPIVNIAGVPYLDGGLAEPVPILKAEELGNEKIILVLTRNPGYRMQSLSKGLSRIYQRSYGKQYPEFVKMLRRRYIHYNHTMEYIEQLESEGKIFVIRPHVPVVSRMENHPDKLIKFYNHGYQLMESQYDNLLKYLEK